MSEYSNFPIDFLSRTIENIENYQGPFETTNLINNCLGLILIPRQYLISKLPPLSIFDIIEELEFSNQIQVFEAQDNYSLIKIFTHIRNGIAHGRIEQISQDGEIVGVKISDRYSDIHPENFTIELLIPQFKKICIKISNYFLTEYN